MRLTPAQLRTRRVRILALGLLLEYTCRATTELSRQSRLDDLDDTNLQRCAWCGTWAATPTCARCTPTHPIGETP